jgi:hypothetical protein
LSDTSWQAGMQSENPNLGQQDCGFVMDFELQPSGNAPAEKGSEIRTACVPVAVGVTEKDGSGFIS